jgi:hypothetical protein
MRILLAGILGGIAMFVWTSIAHMALPLGEAGIREIPNESAVLSATQSSMGEKTGLYIFPGLGVAENATRDKKNEAMKQMQQKIAASPSGILMYHPPGRPFAFGKSLAIEFSTEVLQAILVIWLLAQTGIASFAGRFGFVFDCRNYGCDNNECLILELVRFSRHLHRQLYIDRDCRFRSRWSYRRANAEKAHSVNVNLMLFSTRSASNVSHGQCRPTVQDAVCGLCGSVAGFKVSLRAPARRQPCGA